MCVDAKASRHLLMITASWIADLHPRSLTDPRSIARPYPVHRFLRPHSESSKPWPIAIVRPCPLL